MKRFIVAQLQADGLIYFIMHFRACMDHCRKEKRLDEERNDPIRQAAIARYVDALYEAGDLR